MREIRFEAYQHVNAGDTLVILEDSEFKLRLAQAQSDLARAEQQSKATGSSIRTTTSSMDVTAASIEEARVNMENLQREDERYEKLLAQDAVTRQQYDRTHTAYLSAKARVPEATVMGAVSMRISSHAPAAMNELRVAAPPSTMSHWQRSS